MLFFSVGKLAGLFLLFVGSILVPLLDPESHDGKSIKSAAINMKWCIQFLAERFGSGDGERETLMTRQIAFEPLPASVLLGLCWL
jgi:hypothetical protein